MKKIKIEIESEQHSTDVQEAMFDLGGFWKYQKSGYTSYFPIHLDKKYLFMDEDKHLTYASDKGLNLFVSSENIEVKLAHLKQKEFLVKFLNRKMSIHISGETAIREVLDSGIYKVKDKDFLNRLIK